MRETIGILIICLGFAVGVYVGGWVCFIGGIIDVIEQIRAEHLNALSVALGIGKVVFAGFFGWVSGIPFIVLGNSLID